MTATSYHKTFSIFFPFLGIISLNVNLYVAVSGIGLYLDVGQFLLGT